MFFVLIMSFGGVVLFLFRVNYLLMELLFFSIILMACISLSVLSCMIGCMFVR